MISGDVTDWFLDTASSGNLALTAPVALAAGLVSFFSPCVVPLLPGYLSYVSGVAVTELDVARRGRIVAGALLFVLGFSAVFVAGGALFGAAGQRLLPYRQEISIAAGVLLVVMGLVFLGRLSWLQRDVRAHGVRQVGLLAAPLLGVVFGVGWTPCIGPALGAIFALSAATGTGAVRGGVLAFVYALGLGLPFILVGLAFGTAGRALGFLRRNARRLQIAGGILLTAVGIAIATGVWNAFVTWLRPFIGSFETAL